MKVIIVGSGTAGLFAGVTLKKYSRDTELTVIDRSKIQTIHPCAFPFGIEKEMDLSELCDDFVLNGADLKEYTKLLSITEEEKKITIQNISSNENEELSYDKLILATGSSPIVFPSDEVNKRMGSGVFTIKTLNDFESITNYIKNNKAETATVLGAGAVGLEMAEALKERGLNVNIVELKNNILPNALDDDISSVIKERLEEQGINVMTGHSFEELTELDSESDNSGFNVKVKSTESGEEKLLESDMILFCIANKPNSDYLEGSNIEVNSSGIKVDENLKTNNNDIYAIGDVNVRTCLINEKDIPMKLAVPAYKQGILAAKDILGFDDFYNTYDQELKHKGNYFTFGSKIYGLEIAATGLNSNVLKNDGFEIEVAKVTDYVIPEYIAKNLDESSRENIEKYKCTLKLIVCKKRGRILGAQAIGHKASEKINIISIAIANEQNIFSFAENELIYSPLLSETYDITMKAADLIVRKLYRNYKKSAEK